VSSGWQTEKLGSVCAVLNRGISPKYIEKGGICILNQKCVRDHRINYGQARRHDIKAKAVNRERLIQIGDVLINSTGTGTLGRVAQVRDEPPEPTTVDSHVTIVRPRPGKYFPDFFGYMLIFIEEAIKEAGEGCGGQTELARSVLAEKFLVNYPTSIIEQERIVAILDKVFAAIVSAKENAEVNLKNTREIFGSYLQSAFIPCDSDWKVTTLEQVLESQPRNGWSPPAVNHSDKGVPVLTLSAVTRFIFRADKIKYTSAKTDPRRHYWVNNGDFLITRSNTPELVGHVAIAAGISEPTIYPDLIMRMVPAPDLIMTKFLYYQMRTLSLRREIMSRAQGANPTMKKISKVAVQTLPIVVPSLSIQKNITSKLDKILDETQRLESIYQQKLTSLEDLKKSILHKAFSGELKGASL
jgi:type I restriction enzyme, S subunit